MARKRKDHSIERDDIAKAAQKSIIKLGLHNCSLKDIADQAGYTTGKLMYYFRDKEELLFYAKNQLFDEMWIEAKSVAEQYEGIDKLIAMALVDIPLTPEGIHREKVLSAFKVLALSSPKVRRRQIRRDEKGWLQFQYVIEKLQEDGIIDKKVNSKLAAFGIIAFIEGMSQHFIISPKVQDEESIRVIVTQHVYAMVGAPPADP